MEFSPRYVAIFLLSIGISNVAVAGIDAACMPIINSSEARAAKRLGSRSRLSVPTTSKWKR